MMMMMMMMMKMMMIMMTMMIMIQMNERRDDIMIKTDELTQKFYLEYSDNNIVLTFALKMKLSSESCDCILNRNGVEIEFQKGWIMVVI